MSTFGEIVEPASRNTWEDWDDFTPDHNFTHLIWNKKAESLTTMDSLFIFEGKCITDCLGMQSHHKLELINSIPEVNLNIYKIKNTKKYLCIIKNYDLLLSSEIVDLLKPFLTGSNNVVSIQTKPLSEYQSSAMLSNEDCIIRSVSTSNPLSKYKNINFPKLEQPNIISGVTAGAICFREHLDLPGLAILCYMEHPEEYQIDELQILLEKLDIVQNLKSRRSGVLTTNLYI